VSFKVQQPFELATDELWFFTFGYGHVHPRTGARLDDRFVTIRGTFEEARLEMIRRFGRKWCGQYPSAADTGLAGDLELTGQEALGVSG
jgi:hypothetical protein